MIISTIETVPGHNVMAILGVMVGEAVLVFGVSIFCDLCAYVWKCSFGERLTLEGMVDV